MSTMCLNAPISETPVIQSSHLEEWLHLKDVYLKVDTFGPSSTHKWRVALAVVKFAKHLNYKNVSSASCGNFGAALTSAAITQNLGCTIFVPARSEMSPNVQTIMSLGGKVFFVDGDYEECVQECRRFSSQLGILDCTPDGGFMSSLHYDIYKEIVTEVHYQLPVAPRYWSVPVSNGTTFVGISRGLELQKSKPTIIVSSIADKNPIISSLILNEPYKPLTREVTTHTNSINAPLINWDSTDGIEAVAVREKFSLWPYGATDEELMSLHTFLQTEFGIFITPAATASIAGLRYFADRIQQNPGPICVLITATLRESENIKGAHHVSVA